MSYAMNDSPSAPAALHRCREFVGRTTNWLYDHLRCLPRYKLLVLCEKLANRDEFPELSTWHRNPETIPRRLWHRLAPHRLFPLDARRLRRLAPRVLHSHFGYDAVGDVNLTASLGVPWIVSFYGADAYELGRQPEWRDKYGPMFQRATRVLALGPVMAAQLAWLGCPSGKIVIHPLGVDVQTLPSRARVRRPGEPLRVLFAGTFREKKGLIYAVHGVAMARRAGVPIELHLVGDEAGKPGDRETKQSVFADIRRLGLDDIVRSHSFLPFHALIELALRSHVFLAPSVTAADGDAEGTPFLLQQMMATAMPVITTNHSDIPYVFGNLQHLLVSERDSRAIAYLLQGYAETPDRLAVDGMAFRSRICRAFDVHECASRLADVYDTAGSSVEPATLA